MALTMTSGPAIESVSLDDAKAHLRIDGSSEDALIASLILTSRLHIEAALGLALVQQSWRLILDGWPRGGVVRVPLSPLTSVAEVRVKNADGLFEVVPSADYVVVVAGRPQRLLAKSIWPTPGVAAAGVEIDFTAGYGSAAEDVPAPIRQALLLLMAHWYEHRDPIEIGAPQTSVPHAVNRLLSPYRPVRV